MKRTKIPTPCVKCGSRAYTLDRDGWQCMTCGKAEAELVPLDIPHKEELGWPLLTEAE